MLSVILIAGALAPACLPGGDGPFPITKEIIGPGYTVEAFGRYSPVFPLEGCFPDAAPNNCKEVVVEDPETLKRLDHFLFDDPNLPVGTLLGLSRFFERTFNWNQHKLVAVYPSLKTYRLESGRRIATRITKQVEYADRLEIEYEIGAVPNGGFELAVVYYQYGSALVIPRTCKPVVFKGTVNGLIELE